MHAFPPGLRPSLPRTTDDGQGGEGGFALVVVILMCVLLAVILAIVSREIQSRVRMTTSLVRSAEAEAAADAGVAIAARELAAIRDRTQSGHRFPVTGVDVVCRLDDDATLAIGVQDVSGLVNLNLADHRLIAALLIGLGETPESATHLADRLIDFRDEDSERRAFGAEGPEYRAAGTPGEPKNDLLSDIEELGRIMDFTPGLIERLRPYVTLSSATAGLDPYALPQDLRDLVSRGAKALGGAVATTPDGLPAEFSIPGKPGIYRITSAARLASGAAFVRHAEIDLRVGSGMVPANRAFSRGFSAPRALEAAVTASLPRC